MFEFLRKGPAAIAAGARPPLACEIMPEGIAAAVQSPAGTTDYAFEKLPEGAIAAGIHEANLLNPAAVRAALKTALSQLTSKTRDLTLIVPDAAVRVFVLDFDSLPPKSEDVMPVLRFRLRKMVPFEVEHAGVSYQILSHGSTKGDAWKLLVAVIPAPILAEYETAVRDAGYEPGAVLPSTLAALAAVDSAEAVLTAHLSGNTLTTTVSAGQDLLLYRSLELPTEEEPWHTELRRGLAVAAAYYEDMLRVPPHQILFAGTAGAKAFSQLVQSADSQFAEMTFADILPAGAGPSAMGHGTIFSSFASVTGAILGATA